MPKYQYDPLRYIPLPPSAEWLLVHNFNNPQKMKNVHRCEVLWNLSIDGKAPRKDYWLPADLIQQLPNGRFHVVCDNGLATYDAAPECVKLNVATA